MLKKQQPLEPLQDHLLQQHDQFQLDLCQLLQLGKYQLLQLGQLFQLGQDQLFQLGLLGQLELQLEILGQLELQLQPEVDYHHQRENPSSRE